MKIHHISLLTGNFDHNFQFYVGILGLRLIKNSVNQGNIYMRHVYYGDFMGTPGTVLTFFPDQRFDRPREAGSNFLNGLKLGIPHGTSGFWAKRLTEANITVKELETGLAFEDFDQIPIILQETDSQLRDWHVNTLTDVPATKQLTGILGTTMGVPDIEASQQFLRDVVGTETGLELVKTEMTTKHVWGRGSVDHIAYAVADRLELDQLWEEAANLDYTRETYVDRGYFTSVYLLEPGGNRIEFATMAPGFTLDEPLNSLGTTFALPPRFEAERAALLRYYQRQGVSFEQVPSYQMPLEDVKFEIGEQLRDSKFD